MKGARHRLVTTNCKLPFCVKREPNAVEEDKDTLYIQQHRQNVLYFLYKRHSTDVYSIMLQNRLSPIEVRGQIVY